MNQKRITNQILEQKNYTLNSTLNYLFNISNMKKLFSYLLISSMVVLSSCTNYDDQFDDLNTQINSLKGQIEGFSSLSSGLTALQGTVASLQTAIANIPVTPATDVSGLATAANLTALDTALTALAAEVDALTASLANAATSAEVTALAASLATAQSDLSDLLASNNVYTTTELKINSAASLTVAKALGDKLAIINGSVTIENTAAAAMNATDLQAVVDKMVTITGKLDYTHSGTGVTGVVFNNLIGTGDLDLDQEAPISMPKLASAAAVDLTSDVKVTSVSFPELTKVTSFNTLSFTQAESLSMPKFVGETGDAAFSVTLKSKSTIDLSAYNTIDETTAKDVAHTLTVNGPSALTLSNWVLGVVTTDVEVLTLPKAHNTPVTTATKLKEVHLHSLRDDVTFDSTYVKLATVDIIGDYDKVGVAATVAGPRTNDVTLGGASIETLTLAGHMGNVTITGATSLSSVTTSGGMTSFSVADATDLTELTLGHGPNSSSTLKRSDLSVTGATSLTKLVADKINNASKLTLTGNTELASISMAALAAIATETSAEAVNIYGNNLDAQSFQLPSATGATPVVAAKITTNSGLSSLKAYLDKAIAAASSQVLVKYDNVEKVTSAAGLVYEVNGANGATAPGVTYATGKSTGDVVAGAAFTAINVSADSRTYTTVTERKQTNTMVIQNGSVLATNDVVTFNGGQGAVTVTNDASFNGTISDFVSTNADTWVPELTTAISNKLAAAGYAYTLSSANDYGATAEYNIDTFSSTGSAASSQLSTGGFVVVNGLGTSVSFAVATASTVGLATAVISAVNTGALSTTYTASLVSSDNVKLVRRTSTTNSAQDIDFTAYPDMSFGAWSNALSTSLAIVASQTIQQIGKTITKGWRITAVNDGSAKQANLEAGVVFMSDTTGGENLTMTAIPAAGQFGTTSSTLQINYADIVAGSSTVATGAAAGTIDYTAWM